MIHRMKLYYIACDYGASGIEYLEGPFGARWEATNARDNTAVHFDSPERVIVVEEIREVMKVELI